jgi:cell division inhibitor SepF
MSMWKRAMDYLGLGPEDVYDDYYDDEYDDYEEPERPARGGRAPRDDMGGRAPEPRGRGGMAPDHGPDPSSRGIPRSGGGRESDVVVRRPVVAVADDSQVRPRPINQRPVVTAVPSGGTEPHTVSPRRFDAAQEIADRFRQGYPVIMNLEATERDVSRRLIDFASGLCYGLGGTMEKVATGVYLLKPAGRSSFGDL